MSETIKIGSCSLCGGPVVVKRVYMAHEGNAPWCMSCGAIKPPEPVIQMVRPEPWRTTRSNSR